MFVKRGHSMASRRWSGIGMAELMLLLVAAVWGGSYAVAKQATTQLPVLEFIALRFGLTFVVLLPALRPLFTAAWRQGLAVGGLLGANLLAIFVCETFGVSLTTASNAAFLISLCVAFTPFAEWWLLGQRPARRVFWAAGLSALGAGMLSATSATSVAAPAGMSVGWGDALMVMAAVLRAVMVCMTRRLAGRHTLPALTLTAVQAGVMALGAAALSLLAAPAHGAWQMPPATASFWWGMAYLVLLCTVFAFFAQNHAASRASPSRVSLLMGSEPVFGALIAVYGFGERIGPWGWAGGLLIAGAAWWVTVPPRERLPVSPASPTPPPTSRVDPPPRAP